MFRNTSSIFFLTYLIGRCISSPITFPKRSPGPGLGIKPSISPLNDLEAVKLVDPIKENKLTLDEILKSNPGRKKFLVFFTHMADLSSWELAQKISYYLPELSDSKTDLIAIAPGSVKNAKKFSEMTSFPLSNLYVDEEAVCYSKMNFNKGVLPNVPVSPYFKLLLMLAGIGSDGTIPEVLRGYFGDRSTGLRNEWIAPTLKIVQQSQFDALGSTYLRPFELATVRLQNMINILPLWNELLPEDKNIITQLGGSYILNKNKEIIYSHIDTGILNYVNVDKVLELIRSP